MRLLAAGRPVENDAELFAGRVADDQLEQEAVELRLRERVGPLLLDRVLRRHDEERFLERVDLAADGDRVLLHRLEQRRLRLGGGAVDLVGEDDLREDRPALKFEDPFAVGAFHDDVRADDVGGHQVGGELDPVEIERECIGQRPHQKGLSQSGNALEERVAPDEQACQDAVDDLVVTDDDLADLGLDLLIRRAECVGPGTHFGFGGGHRDAPSMIRVGFPTSSGSSKQAALASHHGHFSKSHF